VMEESIRKEENKVASKQANKLTIYIAPKSTNKSGRITARSPYGVHGGGASPPGLQGHVISCSER